MGKGIDEVIVAQDKTYVYEIPATVRTAQKPICQLGDKKCEKQNPNLIDDKNLPIKKAAGKTQVLFEPTPKIMKHKSGKREKPAVAKNPNDNPRQVEGN